MQRIDALNPENASGQAKELFNGIQSKLGMVPNMMRTMGNSPAVLSAYLNFNDDLGKSSLGSKLGELISLTVANVNGCAYCNEAHSYIGNQLLGIDQSTIEAAKQGISNDPHIAAALDFARKVVVKKGHVSEDDIKEVKKAGYSDAAVAEIIAHTALNIFTNYFNNALPGESIFHHHKCVNFVSYF